MRVTLRLFANLRKKLPPGSPRGYCELDLPDDATIGSVLAYVDIPETACQMILLNGLHCKELDRRLDDSDVLSVFPPLAGG